MSSTKREKNVFFTSSLCSHQVCHTLPKWTSANCGCGSVVRAVADDTTPEVCSLNPVIGKLYITYLYTGNCIETTKINKKRPGIVIFLEIKQTSTHSLKFADVNDLFFRKTLRSIGTLNSVLAIVHIPHMSR